MCSQHSRYTTRAFLTFLLQLDCGQCKFSGPASRRSAGHDRTYSKPYTLNTNRYGYWPRLRTKQFAKFRSTRNMQQIWSNMQTYIIHARKHADILQHYAPACFCLGFYNRSSCFWMFLGLVRLFPPSATEMIFLRDIIVIWFQISKRNSKNMYQNKFSKSHCKKNTHKTCTVAKRRGHSRQSFF